MGSLNFSFLNVYRYVQGHFFLHTDLALPVDCFSKTFLFLTWYYKQMAKQNYLIVNTENEI